jgi:hypothetical protein
MELALGPTLLPTKRLINQFLLFLCAEHTIISVNTNTQMFNWKVLSE